MNKPDPKGRSPFNPDGSINYDHPSFPSHWTGDREMTTAQERCTLASTATSDPTGNTLPEEEQCRYPQGLVVNHCTGVTADGRPTGPVSVTRAAVATIIVI